MKTRKSNQNSHRSHSSAIRPQSSVLSLTCLTYPSSHCFTTVERPLQIHPFMQNKANSIKPGTRINSYAQKSCANIPPPPPRENKPNSNPISCPGYLALGVKLADAHYGSRPAVSSILANWRVEMCDRMRSILRSGVQERGCRTSVAGRQSPNAPLAGMTLIALGGGWAVWSRNASKPNDGQVVQRASRRGDNSHNSLSGLAVPEFRRPGVDFAVFFRPEYLAVSCDNIAGGHFD